MIRNAMTVVVLAAGLSLPSQALAWGAPGHQYVGNLAYQLLNPTAAAKVDQLLGHGVSLGLAAVWPDCIRGVSPNKQTKKLEYRSSDQTCAVFGKNTAERNQMVAYATRNWSNCEYAGKREACHKAFHFADINVNTHTDYQMSYEGAPESDVVRAIRAAIIVLQCKPQQVCKYDGPFRISGKRQALFLLTHLVGDIHQPLHVGAAYLDQQGKPGADSDRQTAGGNLLLLTAGENEDNLHHLWDAIEFGLGNAPDSTVIKAGCRFKATEGEMLDKPLVWATESVGKAGVAYNGLTYVHDAAPKLKSYWDITLPTTRSAYQRDASTTQRGQLLAGGARLAEILNEVWPSPTPATACV